MNSSRRSRLASRQAFVLTFDPIAPTCAVGLITSLRDDALEAEPLTLGEQLVGIGEALREAQEAVVEPGDQPLELRAALQQPALAHADAVELEQIEGPGAEFLRLGRAAVKRSEVRHALGVGRDDLRVDDRALGRQVLQRVGDCRPPRREVGAIAREDRDILAGLVQLDAVAVEFHLVQPAIALRRAVASVGWAGLMKSEGRGTSYISVDRRIPGVSSR